METAPAGAAAPSVSSALPRKIRKIRRGLASRRSTAALAAQINATAQPRPRFLGRTAPGVSRQPLSQSSETPRAPVLVPAETMPGPPGSGVTSPARRNRTRPTDRLSPVDDPRWARRVLGNSSSDVCQEAGIINSDHARGTAARQRGSLAANNGHAKRRAARPKWAIGDTCMRRAQRLRHHTAPTNA